CLHDDFRLALVGNDHDAVRIPEHNVAAAHDNASTLDGYVTLHHPGAAPGVERPDAAVEYGEAHGPNLADVADQSVCHAAGSTPGDARCGKQPPQGRGALGRAATSEYRNPPRLEVVHQSDLHFVGILAGSHRVGWHVQPGARAPEQHQLLIEWPDKGA